MTLLRWEVRILHRPPQLLALASFFFAKIYTMNPDTKLTTEELVQICQRHGIEYKSHERITTGFSHEVHRLNDDLVIKLFNKESNKNFLTESKILALENSKLLKPKLVAAYEPEDGRAYIIMTFVPGKSLGGVWHTATNEQRERLIKQIAPVLQAFQDIDASLLSFQGVKSWNDYLHGKVEKLLKRLLANGVITEERAREVQTLAEKLAGYFQADEPIKPLYWDIHFDNFIVDNDFQLQAIIDLENTRVLPLDYPLFVVTKQMKQPHKYLAEEDEQYASKADYVHLWDWYKWYYPEMFTFDNLDVRIKTYQLLDELHLMIDWSHDAELRESFAKLIDELSEL